MTASDNPLITICIPHWQAEEFMKPCLRSIRKHSKGYNLQVIVIDNGSKDDSLEYLRGLKWIELIERPEESPENWPRNVFTAWDQGLEAAKGDYYMTMHSDVFVKSDGWLEPFLRVMRSKEEVVASGSWKLEVKNPLYMWQKRVLGGMLKKLKRRLPGKKPRIDEDAGKYPRDYCAMYDTRFLKQNKITFATTDHKFAGGHQVATQIWACNGETCIFSVHEMNKMVAHIAHGTTAITDKIQLRRKSKQQKTNQKKKALFEEKWIQSLIEENSLDS